jgi:hypothetical protein
MKLLSTNPQIDSLAQRSASSHTEMNFTGEQEAKKKERDETLTEPKLQPTEQISAKRDSEENLSTSPQIEELSVILNRKGEKEQQSSIQEQVVANLIKLAQEKSINEVTIHSCRNHTQSTARIKFRPTRLQRSAVSTAAECIAEGLPHIGNAVGLHLENISPVTASEQSELKDLAWFIGKHCCLWPCCFIGWPAILCYSCLTNLMKFFIRHLETDSLMEEDEQSGIVCTIEES